VPRFWSVLGASSLVVNASGEGPGTGQGPGADEGPGTKDKVLDWSVVEPRENRVRIRK
jgi:hypothetical protein